MSSITPRTLKRCLICGIKYRNNASSLKSAQCPICGEPEKEHTQFEYLLPQSPQKIDEAHPSDEGCDVATIYDGKTSFCHECPFDACLDWLGHKWNYYSKYKETVIQAFVFLDNGLNHKEIAERLNINISSVYKFQGDREIIQPIYMKLSKMDLTTLKGPQIL